MHKYIYVCGGAVVSHPLKLPVGILYRCIFLFYRNRKSDLFCNFQRVAWWQKTSNWISRKAEGYNSLRPAGKTVRNLSRATCILRETTISNCCELDFSRPMTLLASGRKSSDGARRRTRVADRTGIGRPSTCMFNGFEWIAYTLTC